MRAFPKFPLFLLLGCLPALILAQDSSFVGHYTGKFHMTSHMRHERMKSAKDRKLVAELDKVRTTLDLRANHTYEAFNSYNKRKSHGTWLMRGKNVQLVDRDGKNASTLTRQSKNTFIAKSSGEKDIWVTLVKKH